VCITTDNSFSSVILLLVCIFLGGGEPEPLAFVGTRQL